MSREFEVACAHAVGDGVTAAALIDREGNAVAIAGALTATDLRAIACLVSQSLKGDDLASSLFAGENFQFAFDQQTVSIRVAARCVFVAVVIAAETPATHARAAALHRETERIVRAMAGDALGPPLGSGSGGAGPAELPAIELGVTPGVRRRN